MRKAAYISAVIVLLLSSLAASAQSGAYNGYTPYSIFGIGDLNMQGNAYNAAMGGTGIATRSHKHLNFLNPASVTARDSLSFMADFSLRQDNRIYAQGDLRSANNTMNISSMAISFPIYRSSAMIIGLAPYSSTGYGFYDTSVLPGIGAANATSTGQGSISQLFVGGGVTFFDRLSVGAQWNHYFGSIEKKSSLTYEESGLNGINSGYNLLLKADALKAGVQYEQHAGDLDICFGATFTTAAPFRGMIDDYQFSSGSVVTDTLKFVSDTLRGNKAGLAPEFGIGISVQKGEKWRAEVNYTRSDWTGSRFASTAGLSSTGSSTFTPAVRHSFRGGIEYVPNVNDIRYYLKRCTYRAGAYYETSYFKLDGNSIDSFGITLGATFPIFMMYNGLTIAADLGQRASMKAQNIRERYVGVTISFNTYDIWFMKHRYN